MGKKKKAKSDRPIQISRFPDFSPQFKEDLGWWYKGDRSKVDKIFELVSDVMRSLA